MPPDEVDVSVVIPMYNAGADVIDCLVSLAAQTLSHDRFEVVVVDDGSTDSSPTRVDAFRRRHPALVTTRRIAPSSGTPSRPRNVGLDCARGRYVFFADSDDTLAPEALARMLDVGLSSDADMVLGKISSGGPRDVYHPLFRASLSRQTIADVPSLVQSGAVYKLFRRQFLLDHGIRFPEGRFLIEDQYVCARAYARARSIAVVSDLVCYFHRRRRTPGEHFGDTPVAPKSYAAELAMILDVVEHEMPAEVQPYVAGRYFRIEMLGRLRGPAMLGYDEDYRRALIASMRDLASARVSCPVRDALPAFPRAQARLLEAGDEQGLLTYARVFDSIRLRATATGLSWVDGVLVLDIEASLREGDAPLRLECDDSGWLLPERLAPGTDAADRRLGPADFAELDLDCACIARVDGQLWSNTEGLHLDVVDTGEIRIGGTVRIAPSTLVAGKPCADGLWDLRLRARFAGLSRSASLIGADAAGPAGTWVSIGEPGRAVTAYWTAADPPALALDVGEWMHPLQDLVDVASASITDRGLLQIAAPQISGPPGGDVEVALTLLFTDATEPPTQRQGRFRTSHDGSIVEVDLSDVSSALPAEGLLRIGPLGGAPPREIRTSREEVTPW